MVFQYLQSQIILLYSQCHNLLPEPYMWQLKYRIVGILLCMLDFLLALWVSFESMWAKEIELDETESFYHE